MSAALCRHEVHTVFQFMEAVAEAFSTGAMTTIVAKVEAVGPDRFHMDLAWPENASASAAPRTEDRGCR